ncbi:helix-turn-helix domain-containing protein [Microlunatus aurantiacus]|uniref:Helix-turn-helix domain-containing protein n=1 Tax=Microlunatus aurantiacus TaxID=446786 RepID=A0ABP7EJL5_9ACTN
MAVLLDTLQVLPRDRMEAIHAAYADQSPRRTVFVAELPITHRIERVDFGPEAHLLRATGSAVHIIRNARQVRTEAPEHVALGLHRHGRTWVSTRDHDSDIRDGHLNCVDMTSPYRLAHRTSHHHEVLIISNRQAGVSVDTVRSAAPALALSPVYDLVRHHVAGLFGATETLPESTRLLTGQATIALVRALLTTAAQAHEGRDAMEEALDARIALYIDAHLGDRELSAEQIAASHHISLRHLYNVWARSGHDQTLHEWIIRRRLDRARGDLAGLDPQRSSVDSVARRNGFADVSHFRRRFRRAFGVTPGEWRADHAESGGSAGDAAPGPPGPERGE